MLSDAIHVKDIAKRYKIYKRQRDRLKEILSMGLVSHHTDFWALKGLSFKVKKGETIGIIGKNGSGKSTLLQIIAGVLKPTSGTVSCEGRIASLLELGVGFNPEFTGRENLYMNGAIMGLTKKETEMRMSAIEEFADIGDFIDQPVKKYSSGMYVRLAFSAAINVYPDILIVDEALAVGDMDFQRKCIETMKSFRSKGVTIIFVTHDIYTVRNFCSSCLWIDHGEQKMRDDAYIVTQAYEQAARSLRPAKIAVEEMTDQDKAVAVINVRTEIDSGDPCDIFSPGDNISIRIVYRSKENIPNGVIGVALYDMENRYICGLNTKLDKQRFPIVAGEHAILLTYLHPPLSAGAYRVHIGIFEENAVGMYDFRNDAYFFEIRSPEYSHEGIINIDHTWKLND